MSSGAADYELLKLLVEKNPAEADLIAQKIVRGFDDYEHDLSVFNETRRQLLEALSE